MTMKNPVHPGEVLREDVIAELGLSVKEAAERLGMSRVALSRVLNCHAAISPDLVLRLEKAGVSTADMWLTLQLNYDLATGPATFPTRSQRSLDKRNAVQGSCQAMRSIAHFLSGEAA